MLRGSKFYTTNLRSVTKQAKFGISNIIGEGEVPEIANRGRLRFYDRRAANLDVFSKEEIKHSRSLYNVYSYAYGCFATMVMNKQHNFNIFTKGYLKDLERTLTGIEQTEGEINFMRFTAEDSHTFSRGTDFKTLHHHSQNGDMDPIVDYLNHLYNFQILYAKNNKPLVSTVKGRVENSANCLIGSSGISCVSQDTQCVFNDANKKNRLVPHAGASFYLTRMPGELGTFLALTGTPFTGEESTGVLGLSDHILNWNDNLEDRIKIVSNLSDLPLTAKQLYGDDGINESVFYIRENQRDLELKEEDQLREKHSEAVKHIFKPIGTKITKGADEINEEIDMRYKQYLRENIYQKALRPTLELGSGATGHYINHYQHFADLYLKNLEFEGCYTTGSFIKHHEMQINRCFYGDSIEEIKENLKKENTKFSRYCLDRMEMMDPLALHVI